MSRLEAWLHHLANLLVGGTGLLYAFFLYLLEPADPYAVVHHPWQPQVQHAHLLAAPLLVFSTGVLWKRHAWERWRAGAPARRRSGLALMLSLAPMVVSGYAIQAAVGPGWRRIWVGVHLGASAAWIGAYLVHQLRPSGRLPACNPDPRPRAE